MVAIVILSNINNIYTLNKDIVKKNDAYMLAENIYVTLLASNKEFLGKDDSIFIEKYLSSDCNFSKDSKLRYVFKEEYCLNLLNREFNEHSFNEETVYFYVYKQNTDTLNEIKTNTGLNLPKMFLDYVVNNELNFNSNKIAVSIFVHYDQEKKIMYDGYLIE